MTRTLVLAAAATLLGVSACKSMKPEAQASAAPPPAPQAAVSTEAAASPQPAVQPKPAEMAAPAAPMETPPAAAKPAEAAAPAAAPAVPAAPPAPAAPAVKAQAPAAPPAAKPAVISRDQAMALAAKGNCVACHKIESRVVGPAWKDVGAKYKNDPNAAATIALHIKSGGSFGWKFGVMPPRGGSTISDADVAALAKFIASLR